MPHIPKLAAMTGVRKELTNLPKKGRRPINQPHVPVPYHGAYNHEEPIRYRGQQPQFGHSISIRNWEGPAPDRVFQQLFDQDVKIDEFTRELVPDQPRTS